MLPGQSPDAKHQNPVTTMPPNDHYQSLPYHIGLQRSLCNIQSIPASTRQIKHQVITYQPAHLPASTIQINYQMCAYQQEFTNQLCCHYERKQHMAQQRFQDSSSSSVMNRKISVNQWWWQQSEQPDWTSWREDLTLSRRSSIVSQV